MNPMVGDALSVSTAELIYLSGLFEAEGLIGLANPYAGWTIEDIEIQLHGARTALTKRGLLSFNPAGQVIVDRGVERIMTALAESRAVVVLTRTDVEGRSETVSLHLHADATVEIRQEGKTAWRLMTIDEIEPRTWQNLGISAQAAPEVPGGELSRGLLNRARDAAMVNGVEGGTQVLREALPDETASALATTLANPLANAAVAVIERNPGGWRADGFAFLEGTHGLWLMRTQGESVCVSPCSAETARVEVSRLVERVARG